jgi:hypothetical protein
MVNWDSLKSEYFNKGYRSIAEFARLKGIDKYGMSEIYKHTKGWNDQKSSLLEAEQKVVSFIEFQERSGVKAKPNVDQMAIAGPRLQSWDGETLLRTDRRKISTYAEMTNDPGILFPLAIIKNPIIQIDWHIECDSQEIGDFIDANLREFWSAFIRDVLTYFDFGFAGFNIRWKADDSKWYYKVPILVLQETTEIKITKDDGSYDGIEQKTGKDKPRRMEAEETLLFTHDMIGGNLYGRSGLRAAYDFCYRDKYYYQWEFSGVEKRLIGSYKGFAPEGETEIGRDGDGNPIMVNNLQLVKEQIQGIRQNSGFVFKHYPNREMDIEDFTPRSEGLRFMPTLHRHNDNQKAKALFLGDRMSGTDQGGSYNLATVQSNWLEKVIQGLIEEISGPINMFYIPRLQFHNFGDRSLEQSPARWVYSSFSSDTRIFLKEIFKEAIRKPDFSWMGDVDFREMASFLNIPLNPEEKNPEQEQLERIYSQYANKFKDENGLTFEDGEILERPYPIDGKLDLEGIEGAYNKSSSDFIEGATSIINEQEEDYLRDLQTAFNKENVSSINSVSLKKRVKYIRFVENHLKWWFREGVNQVVNELDLDKIETLQKRTRDFLKGRANLTAEKQMQNIENVLWGIVLNNLKTLADYRTTSFDIRNYFRKYLRDELPGIAEEVSTGIINLGRDYAVQVTNGTEGITFEDIEFAPPRGTARGRQGKTPSARKIEKKRIRAAVWNATLDSSTCEYCYAMHGLVVDIDSPEYRQYQLPAHNRCRCFWNYLTEQFIDENSNSADDLIESDRELWDNLKEVLVDNKGRSLIDKHAHLQGGDYEMVRVNPPKGWKNKLSERQTARLKDTKVPGEPYEATLTKMIRGKKIGRGTKELLKGTPYEAIVDLPPRMRVGSRMREVATRPLQVRRRGK